MKELQFALTLLFSIILFLPVFLVFTNPNNPLSKIKSFGPYSLKYSVIKSESKKVGKPISITASIKAKDISQSVLGRISETVGGGDNNFQALGWIPYWNQESAFSSFQSNVDLFNYLGLFWYVLRSDGTVQKYPSAFEDQNIINFAHSRGVKVLAVVANLPAEDEGGDWDNTRVEKVISSSSARKKHITDLVNLTTTKNLDGINIDYEALRSYQKSDFTLFIKELSFALHAKGKILGVSLHPKVGENNPEYSNGSEAQDWKSLSKYADQLYIMAYDEHWSTSPPGPLASLPWVNEVLSYAKTQIPRQKLFAGTTLDAYDWGRSPKAKGLTFTQVQSLIKKYNPKIVWDANAKTNYFSYRDGSINHTVWYENNRSVSEKISLFNDIGIENIAFWPLGDEDPLIWTELRSSP